MLERQRDLRDAAGAACTAGDFAALRRTADELVAFGQLNHLPEIAAWGEYFRGIACTYRGDGAGAERAFRNALAFFERDGDRLSAAHAMMNLAAVAIDIDVAPSKARRLFEEASFVIDTRGDVVERAMLRGKIAEVCRLESDFDGAMQNGLTAWQLFRRAGQNELAAAALVNVAHYLTLRRDYTAAIEAMVQLFASLNGDVNPLHVAWYFEVWFIIATKRNQWETAARLLGFAARYRGERELTRLPGTLVWLSEPTERLAAALSADRVRLLSDEGAALSLADARALASTLST
jgi:hypothetical protein